MNRIKICSVHGVTSASVKSLIFEPKPLFSRWENVKSIICYYCLYKKRNIFSASIFYSRSSELKQMFKVIKYKSMNTIYTFSY